MGWIQVILLIIRWAPTVIKLIRELREAYEGDAKACHAAIKEMGKEKLKTVSSMADFEQCAPEAHKPKRKVGGRGRRKM